MAYEPNRWGAKLGSRLAMLVSRAIIYTQSRLHNTKHKLAMAIFRSISDEISHEVDVTLGPLIKDLYASMDESHPAHPVFDFLVNNHGQLKAIVGSTLQGAGLTAPLSTIMNNLLAPQVYNIVRTTPSLLPDSSVIAQSYAATLVGEGEAIAGLESQGIQGGWASRILTLARSWPGVTDSIEFARRGLIDQQTFEQNLAFNGIPGEYFASYFDLVGTPLSPADLALATLRGNMQESDAVDQARESGVSADQFAILLGNTGEPPGLMQLLEGFRRGFIDEATLVKGILQSRYRNEWIPLLEKLRYSPMSVADAVNATVQGHMSMADATKIADENGLEPGMFSTLYETAGEPLSRTEMSALYNRGLVSKGQVDQALRESRIKDKYVPLAFDLHERILPVYTLERALRYGGIAHDQAVQIAMESGYSKDSATLIVNSGSAQRIHTYRDRVVSAVQALYEDNVISDAAATEVTTGMGYTAEEAGFILKSSEFRREAKVINQVVNAIKSKYLERHITEQQASGFLDAIPVPATQRDYLLRLWNIEHDAYTKQLTAAEVAKAVKDQILTTEQGMVRLVDMGYSNEDATIRLELG